jgi:two-component sensor histidine kinase
MRELNHRVKNNLAMVSSLISLKDSETDEDLSDLKHRIDVIKLVHEKLHQQNNVEHINVKVYFQELLESIFSSTSECDVDLINNVEEVSLPAKTTIPLGLIVNEIATNAIKYGFTPDKEARFTMKMTKDSTNKQYILTLSNTGNPFPEDIGLENPETMGLQLVSTLVDQIDGTIELQKKPNPVFTIRFPIGEEQMADRIGDKLVKIGAMTKGQVDDVLQRQKDGDSRLFGEIAIELEYIDDEVIAAYLERKTE